jgi:predicted nucleotidyltransferase
MAAKRTKSVAKSTRSYYGAKIPMRVIRRYARQVADRFKPDKIILFGSYAHGTPHEHSDVDLLVIMPCRNELDMAVKITWELPAPFPSDLLVRKPEQWQWRIREGESFSKAILTKGKVLYAQGDPGVGEKSRVRSPRRRGA